MSQDPIAEFAALFERAKHLEEGDATACALASANDQGLPSVRMVLLKEFGETGFVFYTNYRSRKALELDSNPHAALCFYWYSIGQQVRIEGNVKRVTEEESDAYFASRGRQSRIGAWASKQSQPLESRARLLRRVAKLEARYALGPVPRPPFWGGFRVIPERIEFWSNELYRLHDRRLFTRRDDGWVMERLYP
ncbi:MAG: pyridoxamine 5'-phosphate oxidase [bacterium]|nr:pyridoxamine 5'-phosphate oxidase [bacterium]